MATKQTSQNESSVTKAPSSLPAELMQEMEGMKGAGSEEQRPEDQQIPTLVILQSLSPQLKKTKEAYIPGAQEGMICDTLTGRTWDGEKGIEIVPVYFRPRINHMKIGGSQAEFIASYPVDDPFVQQPTKRDSERRDVLVNEPGTFFQLVNLHYVVLPETGEAYAIRMKRTAIRPSKRLNSLLTGYKVEGSNGVLFNPPRFAIRCQLSTVPEEKDGKSFYNWSPKIIGRIEDLTLYETARKLYLGLKSGRVIETPEAQEPEPADDAAPF